MNKYIKYKSLDKYIEENNVNFLKANLCNRIYSGKNTKDFDEFLEYLEYKNINLNKETLRGELLYLKAGKYSSVDLTNAVLLLKENFCDERIEDVKKIKKEMYKNEIYKKYIVISSLGIVLILILYFILG